MAQQRYIRFFVLLIAAVFVAGSYTKGGTVQAAPRSGHLCEEKCDSAASCDTECYATEIDFGNSNATTCYDWAGNDSACDFGSWDTCNWLCSVNGSAYTSCLIDGQSATCGDFNLYDSCGDGACADDEDVSNCPADCGADDYTSAADQDLEDLADAAIYYGYDDGSVDSAGWLANQLEADGYFGDSGNIDEDSDGGPDATLTCSDKMSKINNALKGLGAAKKLINYYNKKCGQVTCTANENHVRNVALDAFYAAQHYIELLQEQNCVEGVLVWVF